jgi:hypothetical protein
MADLGLYWLNGLNLLRPAWLSFKSQKKKRNNKLKKSKKKKVKKTVIQS